jgi:hypothetical protein
MECPVPKTNLTQFIALYHCGAGIPAVHIIFHFPTKEQAISDHNYLLSSYKL